MTASNPAALQGYRGALLRFDAGGRPIHESDGLLVVRPPSPGQRCASIADVGDYATLRTRYPQLAVTHWPGKLIAPGFIDLHIHYPQTDIIGAPADGLLPWLENYTFPAERAFADFAHAQSVAQFFLDELLRQGVTTALVFSTSHPQSVDALFSAALARGLRLVTGKVLQDRHSPDGVRDATAQSLRDTQALIERWHNKARLGYAITPRFAPTSSPQQLEGAGALAARFPDTWIQSHVAENHDEVRWVQQLYPAARSYLDVYVRAGLVRERAIYAHCIHLDDEDRAEMRVRQAAAAVSPTSNLFLGSGFFDFAAAERTGMPWGLASDVGGGTSFSPFHTMLAAYYVGREGHTKQGLSLQPSQLWWHHTGAAARALGLEGVVGNLQVGAEADFVVLDPQATPLLARRTARAQSLEELLFALIVLGDDRVIAHTQIATPRTDAPD
ncbi:guanine deaminase [Lampropedia cohaerens]|uniref:Guanine deaminase n=1 Tax=Lampropedia cohaerens TaxID=1610491 RepID=A0A0U1Q1D3_9BURK|nr:guanine deaminase [Lampropedia cohaerens]KKW68567.1 guanine deaminase [Lampropedia cohaerens]